MKEFQTTETIDLAACGPLRSVQISAPRPHPPPTRDDGEGEEAVTNGEDPERRVEEEDLLQPVGDKGALIGGVARFLAEEHFQGGERADDAEPGLDDDKADGGEVAETESAVPHPRPFAPAT